jgi:carboxyl-terminal processing protease
MRSILRSMLVCILGAATASSAGADDCLDPFCISRNGGFEQQRLANGLPEGWQLRPNSSSGVALASGSARSGAYGLRLEKRDGVPPVAIEQPLTARISGNSILRVDAWLRSETGVMQVGGLYADFKVPGDDKPKLVSTFKVPLPAVGAWEERSLTVRLPAGAFDVRFGAAVVGTARVSIDDVSAVLFDQSSQTYQDRNQQAAYLAAAIDQARRTAIHSARLDWPLLEKQAAFLARKAVTPADVHPALEFLAAALEDGHSRLIPRSAVRAAAANPAPELPTVKNLGGFGYIVLPSLPTTDPEIGERYVASAWQQIADVKPSRGWILDLRGNGGGNVHPMLLATAAFLGDGDLAASVVRGDRTPYRLGEHGLQDLRARYPYPSDHLQDQVVVLVGRSTLSSGEMVAIAFKGRTNTCIAGEKTGGLATVVRPHVLSDGSTFAITVGMMADRMGRTYPDGVEPDHRLEPGGNDIEQAVALCGARSGPVSVWNN